MGKLKTEPWVTVGAYANGWEADLALSLLQAEGLPADLENREFVGMDWTMAVAAGWIKVLSPRASAEAARAVLAKMEDSGRAGDLHLSDAELTDAELCLRCGGAMPVHDVVCDACGWSYGQPTLEDQDKPQTSQEAWNQKQDRRDQIRSLNKQVAWLFGVLVFCVAVAFLASWIGADFLAQRGFFD